VRHFPPSIIPRPQVQDVDGNTKRSVVVKINDERTEIDHA
jgi:hypothetical protein